MIVDSRTEGFRFYFGTRGRQSRGVHQEEKSASYFKMHWNEDKLARDGDLSLKVSVTFLTEEARAQRRPTWVTMDRRQV
jgi:hypothetical protein